MKILEFIACFCVGRMFGWMIIYQINLVLIAFEENLFLDPYRFFVIDDLKVF